MKRILVMIFVLMLVFSMNASVFTQDSPAKGDKTEKDRIKREKKVGEIEELKELFKDDPAYQKILELEKKLEVLKKQADEAKKALSEAMKVFKEKIKELPKYKEFMKQKNEEAERLHLERLKTDPEYKKKWEE